MVRQVDHSILGMLAAVIRIELDIDTLPEKILAHNLAHGPDSLVCLMADALLADSDGFEGVTAFAVETIQVQGNRVVIGIIGSWRPTGGRRRGQGRGRRWS